MDRVRYFFCSLIFCAATACFGADYFATSFRKGPLDNHLEENTQPGIYVVQNGKLINSKPDVLDFVRTVASNYNQADFVFELTIVAKNTNKQGNSITLGIGPGKPGLKKSIYMSLRPTSNGLIALSSYKYGWQWDSGHNAIGLGTHRVRLVHKNGELAFQVDKDYAGQFGADYEYTVRSDLYGLDNTKSHLFFGTNDANISLSALSITKSLPAPPQPKLKLIPAPQKIELSPGSFPIVGDTPIVLAKDSDDDRFAAVQLQKEIETKFNFKLRITKKKTKRSITLTRIDSKLPAEGYRLSVRPDGIVVAGADAAGLFYGVQTLRQLIRANTKGQAIPCCIITDWPSLKLRGWQHDISRGPIPTMEFLKREVRTLAHYKLNFFTLYTEHVFRLKKHPTIAPPEGITAEQVMELDEYCKKYHVQLLGNFQSFGHTVPIQWTPGYAHLFKNGCHYPWSFDPGKEEVYKFLADVYSEIAPAYQSPLFVINCDEVGGMSSATYAGHISRVAELLKPYGKTPMMWGDIALHKKDIIKMLPEDVIFLTWNYYARNSFESSILPIAQAKRKFLVCPAVWSFGCILPRFQHSIKNISNFVRDGAKYGALGTLCTQWQDAGEELSNANWYLLIWAAENAWKPAVASENQDENALRESRLFAFNRAFDPLFFGLKGSDICQTYLRLSRLRYYPFLWNLVQHSDRYMYRGFWGISLRAGISRPGPLGLLPGDPESLKTQISQFLKDIDGISDKLKGLREKAKFNADTVDSILFSARRIRFMAQRALARVEMGLAWRDVPEGDKDKALAAFDVARKQFHALLNEVEEIRVEYVRLWYQENRSWWLPYNFARYDRLRHTIGKAMGEVAQARNRLEKNDQWPDAEAINLSLPLQAKEK